MTDEEQIKLQDLAEKVAVIMDMTTEETLEMFIRMIEKHNWYPPCFEENVKLTIDMPWEKDLSVNHMRFGARGGYRKKPHVQAWMERLTYSLASELLFPQLMAHIWRAGYANVHVNFRFPDKRRRDTHNYFKVIADAVAGGLGIDDKDIFISARSAVVDRENAGFTIEVSDEQLRGKEVAHKL